MKRALIRYRIKPGQALHNGELVRAVYSELERTKPIGLRYATFRHRDGGSLVHIVENDTPDGPSPLGGRVSIREIHRKHRRPLRHGHRAVHAAGPHRADLGAVACAWQRFGAPTRA